MLTRSAGADAALFQALVEYSSDVTALIDKRGVFRFVGRSVERVLGYRPEERLDHHAFELVHEDDKPQVAAAFDKVAASPGTAVRWECRLRHKDGSWRHVEAVAVNRLSESAIGGIVVNYRDVTERRLAEDRLRASEARYRSLISGAEYGIFCTTIGGQILEANPALARMLGYDSVEELCRLNIANIYASSADRARILERYRREGRERLTGNVAWKKKDGTPITVRLAGRIVQFPDGTSGFEAIAEDVTARVAFEQNLRQSQKMEAVGLLARGIAHDFNNLLAAILGCSDLIRLQLKPDDPIYQDVIDIGVAAERGAALTRQLLDFSKRQALEPQVVLVQEVMRNFDMMLQRLSSDIPVNVHLPEESLRVRVEPGQIEQVVMNLVVNARDVTPAQGAIDVTVDSVVVSGREDPHYPDLRAGRYARIAVKDQGPGIAPEVQPHIFEPFFSTKGPGKGSGLGLSIVYGIAKEAGGMVTCRPNSDRGTTFEVLLPLQL